MDELVLIPNYLDLQCYSTPLWLKHIHTATYCDSTSDVASELLRTVFLFHIWEESRQMSFENSAAAITRASCASQLVSRMEEATADDQTKELSTY
jgi:hypothetical protein